MGVGAEVRDMSRLMIFPHLVHRMLCLIGAFGGVSTGAVYRVLIGKPGRKLWCWHKATFCYNLSVLPDRITVAHFTGEGGGQDLVPTHITHSHAPLCTLSS